MVLNEQVIAPFVLTSTHYRLKHRFYGVPPKN